MCYVSRLRLEQKEQISVFLRLLVVGKEAFLEFGRFVEVVRNFILLQCVSLAVSCAVGA